MVTDIELGNRLQKLRMKTKLRQQDVANELSEILDNPSLTQNTIARAEQGNMKIATFLSLHDFYTKKLHPITFDILGPQLTFNKNPNSENNLAIERLKLLREKVSNVVINEIDDITLLLDNVISF